MLNFMVKLWGLGGNFLTFLLNVRLQCKVYLKFVCIKGSHQNRKNMNGMEIYIHFIFFLI